MGASHPCPHWVPITFEAHDHMTEQRHNRRNGLTISLDQYDNIYWMWTYVFGLKKQKQKTPQKQPYYNIMEMAERRTNLSFLWIKAFCVCVWRKVWDAKGFIRKMQKSNNWKKTVGFNDPNIFHSCLHEDKKEKAYGVCRRSRWVRLLHWDFFVARSDHATAVEDHTHQGMGLSSLGKLQVV